MPKPVSSLHKSGSEPLMRVSTRSRAAIFERDFSERDWRIDCARADDTTKEQINAKKRRAGGARTFLSAATHG